MASFKRLSLILLTSCAGAALSACDGADSVASPGAGSVIINNTTIITPPATPTPTPTPAITAAQFAASTTVNSISITPDEQLAIVNAGSNNNVNGTNPLSGLTPQGTAATATAVNPSTLGAFFTSASYVGAVSGASDTAFRDWTCDSTAATFNSPTKLCTAVPKAGAASAGAAPAASVCPTGTSDAGTYAAASTNVYRLCRINSFTTGTVTLTNVPQMVYLLDGPTEVGVDVGPTGAAVGGSSATLNIQPGVVVVANPADAANDVLLINRGSTINAVGTASEPIIFTARQNLVANGTSEATQGLWGGIILLGRAPLGVCRTGTGPNDAAGSSTTCENQIEGVTTPRFYGGPNATDSSGSFQYVQIRFTGIDISAGGGNELQGLTTGGVGSGTVIDHVQSHNSADDGIEIFGGRHNMKYIALTGADDDGLDLDNGWRGLVQFLVIAQKSAGATSDSFSFEIDSNGGEDLLPRTFGTIANFTVIQTATAAGAVRLRGGADMTFVNGIIKSSVPCLNLIAGEVSTSDRSTIRPADSAKQDNGPPVFNSIYFACSGR